MNFEKAYENYKSGKATEEEKIFVEEEIAKAKRLSSIIDELDRKPVVTEADPDDVKKAKKKFTLKSVLRTLAIVVAVLLISTGAVLGGVFGTAVSSAKAGASYSAEDAKGLAVAFVNENYKNPKGGAVIVTEVDRELDMKLKLKHSTYVYYVEVQNGADMEIDLAVNSRTGAVTLQDIDN